MDDSEEIRGEQIVTAAIVRSLLREPLDSEEFEEALRVAGPEELDLFFDVVEQRKNALVADRAEIERRMAELRHRYPGIGDEA